MDMTTQGRAGVAHHARALADWERALEATIAQDDADARAEAAYIAKRVDGHQARLVRAFGEWLAERPVSLVRARCYACDELATGQRDRRPEGGALESACARHAEPAVAS